LRGKNRHIITHYHHHYVTSIQAGIILFIPVLAQSYSCGSMSIAQVQPTCTATDSNHLTEMIKSRAPAMSLLLLPLPPTCQSLITHRCCSTLCIAATTAQTMHNVLRHRTTCKSGEDIPQLCGSHGNCAWLISHPSKIIQLQRQEEVPEAREHLNNATLQAAANSGVLENR
jgi:hypothetical protein